MKSYDLVILGSGSAAFAAAIKASELGARVAMTEHDVIGGTCVNRGCIPSKTLIAAAELAYKANRSPFDGLRFENPRLDFRRLIAQKDELVKTLRAKKYTDIAEEDPNIEILPGQARFVSPTEVQLNGTALRAERSLIATGSRPFIPPIPGLEEVRYLTSTSAFELEELPRSLIIIGGGYIAMELGQMFQRFGTRVTILERAPRILPGFEEEISLALRGYLEEEGIEIVTQSTVQRVRRQGEEAVVSADVQGERREFRTHSLLLATGRVPNSDQLHLEQAGVQVDERRFVKVDAELRTTAVKIWAAGDVTGAPLATPVGAREGIIAAENAIAERHLRMDYRAIPRAVFTDPEVASVGLTEAQAEAQGFRCRCRILDLSLVPKAAAIRDTRGLVKMVIDQETGQVLGVHLIAPRGADIIHEAALAVKHRLTHLDLIDLIHVYPTMAEAIRMAAQMFVKDVSKLSCCAE
ncbi:MAG: mercury(II) reductase [candidate division NC10 bacterium]|nr:mercury(II) reductase [candidate division NC10 bacterium]